MTKTSKNFNSTGWLAPSTLYLATGFLAAVLFYACTAPVSNPAPEPPPSLTYRVAFVTNEAGAVWSEQRIAPGQTATRPTTTPKRTGYNFENWYADRSLATGFNFNNVITSNTTLYAKWQLKTYPVRFITNVGAPAFVTQTVSHGSKVAKPANPTNLGQFFGGWFRDSAGNNAFNFATEAITNALTLYAKWSAVGVTVTFNTGSGGSTVAAQPLAYGQKATRPTPTPELKGHTFAGWFANAATNIPFNFDAPITNAITAYAAWVRQSYTVSFVMNGGTPAIAAQNIPYTNKAAPPTAPKRAGHTFAGWFANAATNIPFNFGAPITNAITAYAAWVRQSYTVNFIMNGGTPAVAAQPLAYGQKATKPADPVLTGHTFAGWFANAATNVAFNFDAPITNAITAYAGWVRQSYTVSFVMNGGTPAVAAQNIPYTNKAAPPTAPKRAGHTFAGWFANAATNIPFNFGAPITNAITAYAAWVRQSYTVSFVMNGGTPAIAAQNIPYTNKVTKPADPVLTGHSFVGWFANAATNIPFNFGAPITNAITAYAAWVRQSYTVSFEMNGGTPAAVSQSVLYTNRATEPASPTRANYKFLGWYADRGLATKFNFTAVEIKSNTTVYAGWKLLFSVTFNTRGGGALSPLFVESGSKASPADPTYPGYEFTGWFTTEATNTGFNFATTAITSNTTVYAGWRLGTYAVTFVTNQAGAVYSNQRGITGLTAIVQPNDPLRAGYVFQGWTADLAGNQPFNFATQITSNTRLHAKWRSGTGSGPAFANTADIAFYNGAAYVVDGDNSELSSRALVRVDLSTGERTVISGSGDTAGYQKGSGTAFNDLNGLAIANGFAYVANYHFAGNNDSVFKVNLSTGARSVLSGGVSEGVTNGSGPGFIQPQKITIHNGNAYVTDANRKVVMKVNLTSGNREVVSGSGTAPYNKGGGPSLIFPRGLAILNGFAYVVDQDESRSGVFKVNLNNGIREVVSAASASPDPGDPNRGDGPYYAAPSAIIIHNGTAYVGDLDARVLFKVELSTGDRTVVSSTTLYGTGGHGKKGEGPTILPVGVFVQGRYAYVVSQNKQEVVRIELATGNRVLFSK